MGLFYPHLCLTASWLIHSYHFLLFRYFLDSGSRLLDCKSLRPFSSRMAYNTVEDLGRFRFGHALAQRDLNVLGRSASSQDPAVHLIVAFDTLYIMGVLFLGAILFTAGRSFHIKRYSTWFIFISTWFLTSLANLLILGQQTGPSPAKGVCLVQAMLIYATPVFNSSSAVAFLLQVHLSIRNAVSSSSMALTRWQTLLIHTFPFALFCTILIEVLILGLLHQETIQRDPSGMYCHLSTKIPSRVTAGITILFMVTFLGLGSMVFFLLRRKWKEALSSKTNVQPLLSPDVATRVLIFSLCPIIALALSFIQYVHSADDSQLNLVLAVLPIIAGLIFGTQRDILRVWMNCVQRKGRSSSV